MSKFSDMAKKATTLSPLMEGRTKISTDDLIAAFPNGITLIEFDIVPGVNQQGQATSYPVFLFKEDPSRFYCGGTVLANIATAWVEDGGGDIDGASAELRSTGGVRVKLVKGKTRRGNSVTSVQII